MEAKKLIIRAHTILYVTLVVITLIHDLLSKSYFHR